MDGRGHERTIGGMTKKLLASAVSLLLVAACTGATTTTEHGDREDDVAETVDVDVDDTAIGTQVTCTPTSCPPTTKCTIRGGRIRCVPTSPW